MSSLNQNVIRHKIGLLNLATELGNVSKACKVMGLSRDTCVFRRSWTLIPRQAGHAFQSKLDSRSVATRGFGVLL